MVTVRTAEKEAFFDLPSYNGELTRIYMKNSASTKSCLTEERSPKKYDKK